MSDELPLQPATRALHALILPPTGQVRTAHTEQLHALVEPIHAALIHVQDKLRDVERAVRAARRVETHVQGTAFFNGIANAARAAEDNLAATIKHIDALTLSCETLDRYAAEWQESNATYADRTKARAANAPAALAAKEDLEP